MLELTKYARKPFLVDAIQVSAENMTELTQWCGGELIVTPRQDGAAIEQYIEVAVNKPQSARQTKAYVGDWLLYAGGGFKVYTNKAFRACFEQHSNDTVAVFAPAVVKRRVVEVVETKQRGPVPTPPRQRPVAAPVTDTPVVSEELTVAAEMESVEVNRDAGTGQFVTDEYALANPATTVEETVQR